MKNRMLETGASGSVRGGDGNIPTYSAVIVLRRAREREPGDYFDAVAVERLASRLPASMAWILRSISSQIASALRELSAVAWIAAETTGCVLRLSA